jgi:hypothetical protein
MDPTYKYRAWYKAFTRVEIGNLVTPKTDPGDYIIEKTGDITVYAGESVVLKPGFHAQNGSTFHAFINRTCSKPPANEPVYTSSLKVPSINEHNETKLARELLQNAEVSLIKTEIKEQLINHQESFQTLLFSNQPSTPEPNSLINLIGECIRNEDKS